MNLRHSVSRETVKNISRFNRSKKLSTFANFRKHGSIATSHCSSMSFSHIHRSSLKIPMHSNPFGSPHRNFQTIQEIERSDSDDVEDGDMTEFLSRFVWIMREKLSSAYPDCDKQSINGMLLIIVGKVVSEMEKGGLEKTLNDTAEAPMSGDFSEDLWRTVWDVSNIVLEDMHKARKKEKIKVFLQSEEVQQMYRFASEVGVRGDMLRELRFKWAREKMEECEFYQNLERLREVNSPNEEDRTVVGGQELIDDSVGAEEKFKKFSLPKRHGKINYKIYGLDLSDSKWVEVADKIHETGEIIWPQEPKLISGKCKLVTDRILSLKETDDPSTLLAEWVELLHPTRVDWVILLDKLKERNSYLYFKVAEHVLSENSFQTSIRDYSKLVDGHAKENRLQDAERILKKMSESGILPDILTFTILVHMYSKAGNLDRAKQAFDCLKSHGFQADIKVYSSMIMAYVQANQSMLGEALLREMETSDLKPTKDIYIALLRSFALRGDAAGAHRISTTMQFAGIQATSETYTLVIEAYMRAGNPDEARSNFDYMIRLGHKPDDKCIAHMLAAYEKKNYLDKALNLLLKLEKDGVNLGVASYTVLLGWMGKLDLVDEAEQLLGKISEQGESPPFEVHVSLCEMYSKAGVEKKAFQALGVLEAKKELLGQSEFERVINGLMTGGFNQEAKRFQGVMEAQGYRATESLSMAIMTKEAFSRRQSRPSWS